MPDPPNTVPDPSPAGPFGSWLEATRGALRGDHDAEVPCGDCTACCTSSQFIHIAPHETETLRRIPHELLFPAPGLPNGHVLMGYDERGHCPMLVEGACSIYDDRPTTCRTYDCRVFAASGLTPEPNQTRIVDRAARWVFAEDGGEDAVRHDAVRAAATALRRCADLVEDGDGEVPVNATQQAVLALEIHDVFVDHDSSGALRLVEPDDRAVVAAVQDQVRRRRRDPDRPGSRAGATDRRPGGPR